MTDSVKEKFLSTLSMQEHCTDFPCMDEIHDTILTMNISGTSKFSIFLLVLEMFTFSVYLFVDFNSRLISMHSFTVFLFLLFLTSSIIYSKKLLKRERTQRIRRLLNYHTYCFTVVFAVYSVAMTYINLQNRLTEESILMFYIYIAAGPIASLPETAAVLFATAAAILPGLRMHHVPPALYSNLLLYITISLCLSVMRCRIIVNNLHMMRKARDEQRHLKERADKDLLTGLYNRNGYSLRLEEMIPYNIRLKIPVAVLMMDVDYFKQYNDVYGHVQGDECLRKVAHALAGCIHQEEDLLCRFGGEEFQVFLCDIQPSEAIRVGGRLRKAVSDLKLPAANRSVSPYVTISVGVASGVLTCMEDYRKLVRAADDELYQAKKHGKNMISFRNLMPKVSHEQSLEDKLENAKMIYENSPFPFAVIQVLVKDGKPCDFTYVYANEACAQLECCSRESLYEKSFTGHYPDADIHRISTYYETAVYGGRQELLDFKSERSKYLKIECFQFHPGYCGCLMEDVTDQHYLELCCSKEMELLNRVINGGILLITYLKEKTEVVYMNTELLQELGYSSLSEYRLSVHVSSFQDLVYPDDRRRFKAIVDLLSPGDVVRSCIIRLRSKEGLWLWFMLRGRPIIDENGTPLILFTAYHITHHLKQLEEIAARGEERSA